MVCSLRLVLDVYGQVPLGKGRSVGHNATWLDEHYQDPQAEMAWDLWKICQSPVGKPRRTNGSWQHVRNLFAHLQRKDGSGRRRDFIQCMNRGPGNLLAVHHAFQAATAAVSNSRKASKILMDVVGQKKRSGTACKGEIGYQWRIQTNEKHVTQ